MSAFEQLSIFDVLDGLEFKGLDVGSLNPGSSAGGAAAPPLNGRGAERLLKAIAPGLDAGALRAAAGLALTLDEDAAERRREAAA